MKDRWEFSARWLRNQVPRANANFINRKRAEFIPPDAVPESHSKSVGPLDFCVPPVYSTVMGRANSQGNGSRSNDVPPWAKELSAEVRAYLRDAAEARKQADEDRRRADEDRKRLDRRLDLMEAQLAESIRRGEEDRRQAAADRRRYAEDSARRHQEFMGALRRIDKIGRRVEHRLEEQTEILKDIRDNHGAMLRDIRDNHGGMLRDIHRAIRVTGNGRGKGNGPHGKA